MYTVIGVMPAKATFPLGAPEFWVPLFMSPQVRSERQQLSLHAVGRLQPGVSLDRLVQEVKAYGMEAAGDLIPLARTRDRGCACSQSAWLHRPQL